MVAPLEERNIPFTFVFGNHDDQAFGIPKEKQLKMYQSHKNCLAVAGDPALAGLCNHYIPLKSEDGKKTEFVLYFIDSLSTSLDGRCAAVTKEQIAWYKSVRDALKAENGNYVPAIAFQHIPVPEMWDLLKEVPKSQKPHAQGFREHYGKYYDIDERFLPKRQLRFPVGNTRDPAKTPANWKRFPKRAIRSRCSSAMTTTTALSANIRICCLATRKAAASTSTVRA